jgi:hypothetical protein
LPRLATGAHLQGARAQAAAGVIGAPGDKDCPGSRRTIVTK